MEAFIPDLLQGLGEGAPGRRVTCLTVKHARMALIDPTNTSPDNWTEYCVIIGHFFAALRGQEEFRMADQSAYLQ